MSLETVASLLAYVVALVILRQENSYTWAASFIERPANYDQWKAAWMLVPRLLCWGSAIALFISLDGWVSVVVPLSMIFLYSVLNKHFTKVFILESVERKYPPYLEGILENYDGQNLTAAEKEEKADFAKVLALQDLLRRATGSEPTPEMMSAAFRRIGWPSDFSEYVR